MAIRHAASVCLTVASGHRYIQDGQEQEVNRYVYSLHKFSSLLLKKLFFSKNNLSGVCYTIGRRDTCGHLSDTSFDKNSVSSVNLDRLTLRLTRNLVISATNATQLYAGTVFFHGAKYLGTCTGR